MIFRDSYRWLTRFRSMLSSAFCFKSTRCDNENNVTRSFRMLACHGMILWLLHKYWQHSRVQCLPRLSTLTEILHRMFKMKGFLAFVLCLVAASGYVLKFGEYDAEWLAWKSFHNKKYETQREEDARFTIWGDNLKVSGKLSFFKWMVAVGLSFIFISFICQCLKRYLQQRQKTIYVSLFTSGAWKERLCWTGIWNEFNVRTFQFRVCTVSSVRWPTTVTSNDKYF